MNEQTIQRKQLKAKLELTEQDYAKGRCTEEQLQIARSAYENFRKQTPPVAREKQLVENKQVDNWADNRTISNSEGNSGNSEHKSSEFSEEFTKIREQLEQINQEKARLSNSLKTIPKNQNAGNITRRILELREEWRRVKDTEIYVIENGCLPENNVPAIPAGWTDKLPRDKFELNKRIKALKINIESPSKWPAALQRAKTPAKKQQIQVKINQGMLELAAMEALFKTL